MSSKEFVAYNRPAKQSSFMTCKICKRSPAKRINKTVDQDKYKCSQCQSTFIIKWVTR